jgi:hypothetical protein
MQQPAAVLWFKVFAVAMAVLYLLCIGVGFVIVFFGASWLEMERAEAMIMGPVFIVLCVPFLILYAVALFLPRKPWVWIYDLVLIAGGFTSCCTLPFCVALLIFWLKPDVKAYFGRT